MKNLILSTAAMAALLTISSCDPKKHDELTGKGPVTIEFENRAGSASLAFGTNYVTANGDTINLSKFKFYVSNFVLVKEDGSEYVVPQATCYHLVDESVAASKTLTLNDIPAGEYTGIKYIIGVDSARHKTNVLDLTGDLDPAGVGADMYWDWNMGFIFYKLEGTSPQSSETGNKVRFHIGGFSSTTTNNIRNVSLTSVEPMEVGEGRNPEAHIYADALEAFKTPVTYSIASGAVIHMPMSGATIANNYADMFILSHVHNDH